MTRQNPAKYLSDAEKQEVIDSYAQFALDRSAAARKWKREQALKYGVDGHEISRALHPKRMQEAHARLRAKEQENSAEWRKERFETVLTFVQQTKRELLDKDAGDYGITDSGDSGWISRPDVDQYAVAELVLDIMEFMRSVR